MTDSADCFDKVFGSREPCEKLKFLNMPGNLEFASENFNADDYVKRLVRERVAGSELSDYKKQLQKEKEGKN